MYSYIKKQDQSGVLCVDGKHCVNSQKICPYLLMEYTTWGIEAIGNLKQVTKFIR